MLCSIFNFPNTSRHNLSLITETKLSLQKITQTFITFFGFEKKYEIFIILYSFFIVNGKHKQQFKKDITK